MHDGAHPAEDVARLDVLQHLLQLHLEHARRDVGAVLGALAVPQGVHDLLPLRVARHRHEVGCLRRVPHDRQGVGVARTHVPRPADEGARQHRPAPAHVRADPGLLWGGRPTGWGRAGGGAQCLSDALVLLRPQLQLVLPDVVEALALHLDVQVHHVLLQQPARALQHLEAVGVQLQVERSVVGQRYVLRAHLPHGLRRRVLRRRRPHARMPAQTPRREQQREV